MLTLAAVTRRLGEELEPHGFTANRTRAYVRETEREFFQCVQVQRSKYGDDYRFTVNVSIIDRLVEERLGYRYPDEKPLETSRGIVLARVSDFISANDVWWPLDEGGVEETLRLLRERVVPALDRVATRGLLIEAWRAKIPPWNALPLLSAAAVLESLGAQREARGVVMHALEVDAEVPARAETFRRFLTTMAS